MDKENALRIAINLVANAEGCRLVAYQDGGGVWTIGFGNTYYMDGSKVKNGDKITQSQANEMLGEIIKGYYITAKKVSNDLNDNQIAALTSFCYNIGIANFNKSTLVKKAKLNVNDKTISLEFLKWNKDNGVIVKGLTNRRIAESNIYFTNR